MSNPAEPTAHLLFKVANTSWAVDVTSVHKVHEQLNVQNVPGTHAWFLGLASVDGQLLPVTDLGAWYAQAPSKGPVLHLSEHLGYCGLRVDEINGTQTLPVTTSALNAAQTVMPGACPQVLLANDDEYRVVQMNLLVQTPAFIAIREAVVE